MSFIGTPVAGTSQRGTRTHARSCARARTYVAVVLEKWRFPKVELKQTSTYDFNHSATVYEATHSSPTFRVET